MADEFEVTQGSTLALDEGAIAYIENWRNAGCGPQARRVFDALALAMPAPCTETVCLRRLPDGAVELLTAKRDEGQDKIWQGMLHSIGSAHMLANYINVHAIPQILATFPEALIQRVQRDSTWWNLDTQGTIFLRIFRRELGLPDATCLHLIQSRVKYAGFSHDLVLRGGETVLIFAVDLSDLDIQVQITKQIQWIPVEGLAERSDFINHQVHRVMQALAVYNQ